MKHRSVRLPFHVLFTLLFLALAFRPALSDPATTDFHSRAEERRRFLHELPYGPAMALAAERHRVDSLLVAAIVEAESSFAPDCVSPKGAVGLMQVLPSTAEDGEAANLLDPRVNLDVGSRYLGELIRGFGGNLELAVAAYNAGPGAVERYGGVPPYPETKDYVKRVLALYGEHQQAAGEI
jgi:soluble lytic murein transglycosylase-like protein